MHAKQHAEEHIDDDDDDEEDAEVKDAPNKNNHSEWHRERGMMLTVMPYLSHRMVLKRKKEDVEKTIRYKCERRIIQRCFAAWRDYRREEDQTTAKTDFEMKTEEHVEAETPDEHKTANHHIAPDTTASTSELDVHIDTQETEHAAAPRMLRERKALVSYSDRIRPPSSTSNIPPPPATLLPLRRTPSVLRIIPNLKEHPGCCGLRNLGNTCYQNSVVQAFSHTSHFRRYYCEFYRSLSDIQRQQHREDGQVSVEIGEVMSALWSGKRVQFTADHLLQSVWKAYERFQGFKQQVRHRCLITYSFSIYCSLSMAHAN